MDAKPTKIPAPDKVACPDQEPSNVEFLADLPEHVRAFFEERQARLKTKDLPMVKGDRPADSLLCFASSNRNAPTAPHQSAFHASRRHFSDTRRARRP